MKLLEMAVGTTFKTGNLEHIILAHYVASDIRNEINTDFLKELVAEVGEENIVEHVVDLLTDDGRKDYGTVTDKISLLTTAQFREFIEILDKYNPGRWWWTATALSSKRWTDCVRCVDDVGVLDFNFCDYGGGVRPFYILKSSISVSDED